MLERFRSTWARVVTPLALFLLRHRVSPDLVTVVGTAGVVAGAVVCFPMGWLWQGVLVVVLFVFADLLDGQMSRLSGAPTSWGAFLDSSLDRFGDAAVFGGILLYFALRDSMAWAAVTLAALVFGQATSYVKARAESLGFRCDGGLAARADRLLIVLVGALLAGLGLPWVLEAAVVLLAAVSLVTVGQRIALVRRQARSTGAPAAP